MSSFTTPPIVQMVGLKEWVLFTPFTYKREDKVEEGYPKDDLRSWDKITVPRGFVTDLATIPRVLWTFFPPHDYYAKAAILHDYLYANAIGTKKEADLVFYEALGVLGMNKLLRKIFYYGVRMFGKGKY